MCFLVLSDNFPQSFVMLKNTLKQVNEQVLQIWEEKDRKQGETKDHQKEQDVHDQEESLVVLKEVGDWSDVVAQEPKDNQDESGKGLLWAKAHVSYVNELNSDILTLSV